MENICSYSLNERVWGSRMVLILVLMTGLLLKNPRIEFHPKMAPEAEGRHT